MNPELCCTDQHSFSPEHKVNINPKLLGQLLVSPGPILYFLLVPVYIALSLLVIFCTVHLCMELLRHFVKTERQ